jgi:hypothetical protein
LHQAHHLDREFAGVFDQTLIVGYFWHIHDLFILDIRAITNC